MASGYDGHRMQQTGAEPTCSCNLRMGQVVSATRVGRGAPQRLSPHPHPPRPASRCWKSTHRSPVATQSSRDIGGLVQAQELQAAGVQAAPHCLPLGHSRDARPQPHRPGATGGSSAQSRHTVALLPPLPLKKIQLENWLFISIYLPTWTARKSNQSVLKDISSDYSLEGLMLKLKLQYCGHLMRRTDSLETVMLGKIEGGRKGGPQRMRWLDCITDTSRAPCRQSLPQSVSSALPSSRLHISLDGNGQHPGGGPAGEALGCLHVTR